MALDAAVQQQYIRQSAQQQVQFAYWLSAGDVPRARLAMDQANWFYQQLGWPFYMPTDLIGYVPHPTDPDTAVALAATLTATGTRAPAAAAARSSNASTSSQPTAQFGEYPGFGDNPFQDFCSWYPDDPYCWDFGFGLYGGGGGGFSGGNGGGSVIITQPTTVVINQTGLTIGDVASRIAGALATAAAAIASAVDLLVASAIKGIQHAITALGNELISVFKLLSRLAGYILNFLKGLLLGVIHGLVAAVQALGRVLKDVFTHGIIPALQALQKLRNYLIKVYERFLRPLLIVLQDLRKVLAILKVFHIGFASKLDAVLSDIQGKISGPLLYLLGMVNSVANYINLILDARLFIQRPLFLNSLNANKGSTLNLLINAMNPPADPAAIAALQAANTIPTPAQASTGFDVFLQSGGGPLAPSITEHSAQFDAYLKQGVA